MGKTIYEKDLKARNNIYEKDLKTRKIYETIYEKIYEKMGKTIYMKRI